MPGRDEALERARLARLRQELNVDRNDNTLFRGLADEGLRGPLFSRSAIARGRSTLTPEELDRSEQAMSAALTGLVAAPLAFVAGEAARQSFQNSALRDQEQSRVLQRSFPGLDSSLYPNGVRLVEQARTPDFDTSKQAHVAGALQYGGSGWLRNKYYDFINNKAGAFASEAGRDPDSPNGADLRAAQKEWDKAEAESPLRSVDWDRSARELGRTTPNRLTTVQNVPQFGRDLGGFARDLPELGDGNQVAYTVVPNANSSRFSQRLLPALVDQVYTKDAKPRNLAPPAVNVGGRRGYDFAATMDDLEDRGPVRPVPRTRMAGLLSVDRMAMLERMAPGQLFGRNQSGYIWGTLTDMPRYKEYGGHGVSNNPEVVVSEVRTPPELEGKYLYTGDTHDPAVRYNQSPEVRAVGPAWGATVMPAAGPLSGRRKRDVAGDISFRSDLIERRGGFSLADAQSVQSRLGLPVAFGREGLPAARALEEAVESIRAAEQLPSHGAVIDKYARRLPRMGSTTSPRQTATGHMSSMPLDTRLGVTSKLQQSFDVPGALRVAGYEPNTGGLSQANADIADMAWRRLKGLGRVTQLAPAAGVLMGLADPQAAELLGTALREEGEVRTGLLKDAARVYGQNAVVGGVQGGMMSAALAAAPRLGLSGLATAAGVGLGAAAPVLAGTAAVQTVDGYLKGATGEGLAAHARRTQQQAQPALRNPVNALFPTPRAVMARTPSGVAQLRPRDAVNPVIQEVRNRVALFKENFNPLRGDLGATELLFGRGKERTPGGEDRSPLRPVRHQRLGSRSVLNGRSVVWTGDSYGWQSPASAQKLGVR